MERGSHKSGGIATNIGIHFFDLLIWLFGKVVKSEVHLSEENKMAGFLELENANVKWFLSIDRNDLKQLNLSTVSQSTDHRSLASDHRPLTTDNILRTYRSIKIDNEELEFTEGFTELHTKIYKEILNGSVFGLEDAKKSIELIYKLRKEKPNSNSEKEKMHPYLSNGK